MSEYTQGVCHDGAAILKDGQPMTVEQILEALRECDDFAAARADLIKELTACQNMLHGLARDGGCSPAYPDGAKAVLERVTGGHAPDFEDKRINGKGLALPHLKRGCLECGGYGQIAFVTCPICDGEGLL